MLRKAAIPLSMGRALPQPSAMGIGFSLSCAKPQDVGDTKACMAQGKLAMPAARLVFRPVRRWHLRQVMPRIPLYPQTYALSPCNSRVIL